jgi:hypothetical protein
MRVVEVMRDATAVMARGRGEVRCTPHLVATLTEVPADMIELLIAARWLTPDEAGDKLAITAALAAFARASLKTFC